MSRNERRLAVKAATQSVARGIDPSSLNEYVIVELVHQIHSRLELSKRQINIDPTVDFLLSKIDLTLNGMPDVPVACGKGCSHCCNIWVSVTAPEVLYIAKRLSDGTFASVSAAYEATKTYSHADRPNHPYPCPHLRGNLCSIYESRPLFCRLAASGDAEICKRSYSNISDENIPTPIMYIFGREAYSTALAVALKGAGLPHMCYEFNSALFKCLNTPDAEARWLAGEDLFSGVLAEGTDTLSLPANQFLYDLAFR